MTHVISMNLVNNASSDSAGDFLLLLLILLLILLLLLLLLLLLILILIEESMSMSKITSKSKTDSKFAVPMHVKKRKGGFP